MTRATRWIVWGLILTMVLDGPLRYALFKIGGAALIYVKDVAVIGLLSYVLLYTAIAFRINRTLLMFLLLIVYGVLAGLVNHLPLMQVLFGAKMLFPFIVGYLAITRLGFNKNDIGALYRVVVPIVVFGLVLDKAFTVPWESLTYEAFDTAVEAMRNRATFGLERLSGFGRSPHETAAMLFALAAVYAALLMKGEVSRTVRGKIYDSILLVAALVGVVLTTSKAALLAFLVLAALYMAVHIYWHRSGVYRVVAQFGLKALLTVLFLYGIVPPALTFVSPSLIARFLISENPIVIFILSSYLDRVERTWPAAFALITSSYHYLTGRGIGGIGAAQVYFESGAYNPADNVYVYMFISFGMVVLALLLVWFLFKLFRLRLNERASVYLLCMGVGLFCFGATGNVVESPVLSIGCGFLLALWQRENDGLR